MTFLDYVDHSMAMPTDAIDESQSTVVVEGRGDHLSGNQEMAYMWRHPELRGVELFRGVYKRYRAARHFHLSPAIGIVSQGAMSSYARGAMHTLPTGTVLLINPGEVHAPRPALPQGWELRAFYFSNDFYAELSSSLGLKDVRFSELFVNDELLTHNLLLLHMSLEQSNSRLELQSKLLSIFGKLAQHYAQGSLNNRPQKPEHGKVMRAKEFLIENYQRVVTLDTLAKVVGLSPYYLLRTFRSTVGITPHDFLTQIRVERAKRLLRLGSTISDVAADTGFVDQAHFTRRFREIMGVTPGRYLSRRTNRR
jgi:AraC-like DNA-binding protein